MDPNTARQVLRLDPDEPLTAAAVESAFARESWERHPSRYPDAAGRDAATAWASTLADARRALLPSASTDAAPWVLPTPVTEHAPTAAATPVRPVTTPRPGQTGAPRWSRRRRAVLVIGIVAASAGVVALVVGAGLGATRLAEQLVDQAAVTVDDADWSSDGDAVRYSADETYFTFPSGLEEYADGRYQARCPAEFAAGCWEAVLIPEASCPSLEVDLEFTNDDETWVVQARETVAIPDARAGEATPVVFGQDDYDYGWIADVRCGEAAGSP
ncbi:hypothetical protein [Agromyces arachidis]|uniref:hypothetical protein n=1 Tax=Agromyces arachidis TaxID=766966 RepID=UPI004056EE54